MYICVRFVDVYIKSYCVRGALQQKVDGFIYIFAAVMEGNHTLIRSFPSYLNQLCLGQTKIQPVRSPLDAIKGLNYPRMS